MKKYLYALMVGGLGVGLLYLMMWQMGLGDYAESPQRVLITRTINRLVAGGRAGLLYEGIERGDEARILVRCKSTAEILELKEGEESRQVCGIFVLVEQLRSESEAVVQVRWE